jgi:hypothetical protein
MVDNSRDSGILLRVGRLQSTVTVAQDSFGGLSNMDICLIVGVEMNKSCAGRRSKRLPQGGTRVPSAKYMTDEAS